MSFFLLLIVRSLTLCDLRCYVLRVPLICIHTMCYYSSPYTHIVLSVIYIIYLSVSCSLLFIDLYSLFIFYVNHLFPNFYLYSLFVIKKNPHSLFFSLVRFLFLFLFILSQFIIHAYTPQSSSTILFYAQIYSTTLAKF